MARPLDDHPAGRPAAVILAGGRAGRLGGIAKPLATIGGTTLLDLAIAAVPTGSQIVVVGPPELRVPAGVLLVREDPPFGGPVAALAAGVAALSSAPPPAVSSAPSPAASSATEWLFALAADQPTVRDSVRILLEAERAPDGVIGLDGTGRRQPLAALYRTEAVRDLLTGNSSPLRLMDLAAALSLAEVFLGDWLDVDTAEDARHFGVRLGETSPGLEGPAGSDPTRPPSPGVSHG
ncbi:NTP transferase domain-containing protein [Nakamurella sp. A5-74]|uniref:NTP transferase domain-containing protein n=1 Tax=Nakamurella sp. A5-74 TaxID=3158264 RepID=A0AAU8DS20_9ACTN